MFLESKIKLLKHLHEYKIQATVLNLKQQIFYKKPEEHHLQILDLECAGHETILKNVNKNTFWLVIYNYEFHSKNVIFTGR